MPLSVDYLEKIVPVVKAAGLEVFDVELPVGGSRTLRVFVWKGAAAQRKTHELQAQEEPSGERGGVNLDECASVSRKIEAVLEEEGLFPEDMVLEVSSPGINRKLSRPEHFEGAVGERLKLKVGGESARPLLPAGKEVRNVTVHGRLLSLSGDRLNVECEENRKNVELALSDIREARVDFDFSKQR